MNAESTDLVSQCLVTLALHFHVMQVFLLPCLTTYKNAYIDYKITDAPSVSKGDPKVSL
jgi:hypothetical protein